MVDFSPDDEGVSFNEEPEEYEFQDDFESILRPHELDALSTTNRPDALSHDHTRAFTIGPRELQNVDFGLLDRPWYIRYDRSNGHVYIASANDAGDGWNAETSLFTGYDDFIEIDFAFTQNADPVVVVERPTQELWIYWYDPSIPGFTFAQFGSGRTPRVALDHPKDTSISDVQVFYVSDANDEFRYRQQRDAYAIEYTIPNIEDTTTKYLEDIYRSPGHRLYVLYSEHTLVTGQYVLKRFNTTLFPIWIEEEELDVSNSIASAQLIQALLFGTLTIEDDLDLSNSIPSATLINAISIYEVEAEIEQYAALVSFELRNIVIENLLDIHSMDLGNSIISGLLYQAVILDTTEIELLDVSNSIASGQLITV